MLGYARNCLTLPCFSRLHARASQAIMARLSHGNFLVPNHSHLPLSRAWVGQGSTKSQPIPIPSDTCRLHLHGVTNPWHSLVDKQVFPTRDCILNFISKWWHWTKYIVYYQAYFANENVKMIKWAKGLKGNRKSFVNRTKVKSCVKRFKKRADDPLTLEIRLQVRQWRLARKFNNLSCFQNFHQCRCTRLTNISLSVIQQGNDMWNSRTNWLPKLSYKYISDI